MKKTLTLALALAAATILISLTFLFAHPLREIFMKAVATPLVESFLIVRWYVHRLPQLMLWALFTIIGSFIAIRCLLKAFPLPARRRKTVCYCSGSGELSDLRRISDIIAHTHRRPFARRRIASELVPLCTRLIAHRERIKLEQARERFESFDWCTNETAKEFFEFRHNYHGINRSKVFQARLSEIVSLLESYYQGA